MRTIDLPTNPSGHAAPVTHVALRPDGTRLASCSYDGTVIIWDLADPRSPKGIARLRHRRLVNSSAWNPADPDMLATASADKTVAVWRISAEGAVDLVTVLARHTDDINSVSWMPDGRRIVGVSEDGRASMWDTATGRFVAEVGSHSAHCMMVSVSSNGLVATVGEDGMVMVTEPDSDAAPVVRHYDSSLEGCAWSRSGEVLAVSGDDGTVRLLTAGLAHLRTIEVSGSAARTVDWTENDETLVVGSYDGSVCVFDDTGRQRHRLVDERIWPRSVSVAGGVIAAGSFRSGPHLFEVDTGQPIATPTGVNHGPNALAVLGEELLVGCDSGSVLAVDLSTDRIRVLDLTDGPILALATHSDAVYAATYSGHVIRWQDGETTRSEQIGAPIPSLCVSAGKLVAGTYNGELVVLDLVGLSIVERHVQHDGSVKSLAVLPGGFASAATDRRVAIGTPDSRTTLWEHGNLVNSVATLGGHVVASASRDHTVKVGRVQDGKLVDSRTLLGPDESVKCVALLGDPAAPVVLAGSYDFALYIWHMDWKSSATTLASGQVLAEFAQALSCMCPIDDRQVAVASWDGTIAVVGIADGEVCMRRRMTVDDLAAAGRPLSRAASA